MAASRAAEKLARLKLDDESHSRLGRAIGVGLGVAPGFALGRGNASSIAWGALTGLAGAGIGQAIGGSIRKNKDKNLSANLKSALHELSDRSEGLVEFGDDLEMRAKAAARSMYKAKAKASDVAQSKDWFMRHPEAIPGKREFARGDFAYPALKKAMGGLKFPDLELREVAAGTLNQSLRKDSKGVRHGVFANLWQSQPQREYPDFFSVGGVRIPVGESDKLMKNTRNWAAQTIRADRRAKREFARGDFLRQAVGKYSDVAPAVVPGVSPSVVGPRGKEWRSQFLLWARKRAAKQMV